MWTLPEALRVLVSAPRVLVTNVFTTGCHKMATL